VTEAGKALASVLGAAVLAAAAVLARAPEVRTVAGALARTLETRVLRFRLSLVMNKTLFAPALDSRHRTSLANRDLVQTGSWISLVWRMTK
jgi:hypothetical protein